MMITDPNPIGGTGLFVARGWHGLELGIGADNLICQVAPGDDAAAVSPQTALLYRPPRRPELVFLLAADGRPLGFRGQSFLRPFRVLFIGASPSPSHVALTDALSDELLTCVVNSASVEVRTKSVSMWEQFELLPCEVPASGPVELLALLERFSEGLATPRSLGEMIAQSPADYAGALVEAALLVQDDRRRESFVRGLMQLKSTLDADGWPTRVESAPWFVRTCQALYKWSSNRQPTTERQVGAEYDFLGIGSGLTSALHNLPAMNFLRHARRLVQPRRAVALLGTARDEGLYLLEWIAHHRLLGVEHIFLYTNNNTDGSDALLDALDKAGVITWFDNTPEYSGPMNLQNKAYAHALSVMPEILDYEWTLVVDLDEHLWLSPVWNNDLRALLRARAACNADSVAFSWRVYYPGRQLGWEDKPMGARYDRSGPHPLVKSALRTNRFAFSDAHHPHLYRGETRGAVTADGEKQKDNPAFHPVETRNGLICHFAVRSLEEYVWKYARGENDGSGVLLNKRFRFNNPSIVGAFVNVDRQNSGEPDDRYHANLPALEQGIAALRALPGVDEAYRAVVANYRRQIGTLVRGSVAVVNGTPQINDEDKAGWLALVDRWEAVQVDHPVDAN